MVTRTKVVPIDEERVDEHTFSEDDYAKADANARKRRERILAGESTRDAYDRAAAEIDRHQLTLAKLRKARTLAQAQVAETMEMQQSEVSRLEHRTDFLLSTLRKFVEATGGELVLLARYPEGEVELVPPGEQVESHTAAGRD